MNEETFKNRYLEPYLLRQGFDLSELEWEYRVTVQIGRTTVRPSRVTGVLDILVSRNGQNLFLVEAKHPGENLTSRDRDQGISYASLVRPIAPYVLVTNGDDFRLYETLSKEEVSGANISPDSNFTVALPQELVEDAISHFLGLSPENLAEFSRLQVSKAIQPLIGSKERPFSKFIPELFVERTGFIEAVLRFLSESKVLFSLIADSGGGKTCCLCDLALRRVERRQPVLFYRGINLNGSILEAVLSDFGWTFSENLSQVGLVRRLEPIVASQKLLIVIDGIDEWEYESRRQDLLATAQKLSAFSNIRLIFSCKTTIWNHFTTGRGQPTGIEDYLYNSTPDVKGFVLPPMSNREFDNTLHAYKKFYGVRLAWEDVALNEARRNPFFMRVLFEVAQKRGDNFILLSSVELFRQYLDQAISRLRHPEDARLLLVSIAGALFAQGEERFSHVNLVKCVGAIYDKDILRELIEYQILERTTADSDTYISFYFSLLRDYIVAFHSEQWQNADEVAFIRSLEALGDSTIRQEALAFFYRFASRDKQHILDFSARQRAKTILETYTTVLSTDLQPIRNRFVPYTSGPIGYVGTFIPGTDCLGLCNFRELKVGNDEILLLPALDRSLYDTNLPYLHQACGVVRVIGIGDSDLVAWTVNNAIGHQLREIVGRGRLRESNFPMLVAEALACTVSRSSAGYSGEPHPARIRKRPPKYPRQIPNLFPLETNVVRRWLRYRLLYDSFREERIEEKLANGEIPVEHFEDGTYGYDVELSLQDMEDLDHKIAAHIDLDESEVRRLADPVRNSRLLELDRRVTEALDDLEAAGIYVLEDEIFPDSGIMIRRGFSTDALCHLN